MSGTGDGDGEAEREAGFDLSPGRSRNESAWKASPRRWCSAAAGHGKALDQGTVLVKSTAPARRGHADEGAAIARFRLGERRAPSAMPVRRCGTSRRDQNGSAKFQKTFVDVVPRADVGRSARRPRPDACRPEGRARPVSNDRCERSSSAHRRGCSQTLVAIPIIVRSPAPFVKKKRQKKQYDEGDLLARLRTNFRELTTPSSVGRHLSVPLIRAEESA